MFEKINFQGKLWRVVAKVDANKVEDPSTLKTMYRCDMVIKDKTHYWILDEIINAEFEEL